MQQYAQACRCAVQILKKGQPIIFPTDTLYGLGVSVRDASSPEILYTIKKRKKRKPIAWLVDSVEDLLIYGKVVPELALALARTFWPGPLTIIVRASNSVPKAFCSEEGTIGMRMPNCPETLELIKELGCPIATTSANISGKKPPYTFEQIDSELINEVPFIFNNDNQNSPKSGIASTIVDCTTGYPIIKRIGAITIEDIQALS